MAREAVTKASGVPVLVADTYEEISTLAADIVERAINTHPGSAMTLPTGETPRGMYEELTRRIEAGTIDFGTIEFFCMDDYLGKGIDDEASLTAWLDDAFLTPAKVHGPHIHLIPTLAENPREALAAYDQEIEDLGGFKLAVLGLGPNGHIGFNEPGSPIDAPTRIVDLTEESRHQNAAYYEEGEEIPAQAMTVGVSRFLEAEQVVLIVSGVSKSGILRQSLEGPVTDEVPGSYLQTIAEKLTVIVDVDAASQLDLE
jgi:glucosamine-6-phosphate deaminase